MGLKNVDVKIYEGSLVCENGDVQIIKGKEAIVQRIKQELRTELGEWFMNVSVGIPYIDSIREGKNPNMIMLRTAIKSTILSIPYINKITDLEFQLDNQKRTLHIRFITDFTGEVEVTL